MTTTDTATWAKGRMRLAERIDQMSSLQAHEIVHQGNRLQFQLENQQVQSRVESPEKSLAKEEFLESIYSQQVDQLRDDVMEREEFGYLRGAEEVEMRKHQHQMELAHEIASVYSQQIDQLRDVMEREEEIYRLKTQQTQLTTKATGAMDSTRPSFGKQIYKDIGGDHHLKRTSAGASNDEEQVVEGPKEQYCAQLYKSRKPDHWRVHFVITKDLEPFLTIVQQKYAARAIEDISFRIEFEDAKISLDIPSSGLTLESGWKITPLFHPTIKKADVDGFACGKMIPECVLVLHWTKTDQPPLSLLHRIPLLGARGEQYFMLHIENLETSVFDGSISELSSPRGSVSSPRGSVSSPPPPQTVLVDRPKVIAYLKKINNNQDLLMVGESLGLDGNELKKNLISETFLFDLIGDWLSRKHRVNDVGTPTWRGLVQALEHVGQSGLANDIKKDQKLCS